MLLAKIKTDRLLAKKNGKEQVYEALTTLFSEIQRMEKADQENDEMVQKVIVKSVKSLNEMIEVTGAGDTSAFEREIAILSEYLPKQMSEDELKALIVKLAKEEGAESARDMGKIMKRLSTDYKGQYDGRAASQLIKDVLS